RRRGAGRLRSPRPAGGDPARARVGARPRVGAAGGAEARQGDEGDRQSLGPRRQGRRGSVEGSSREGPERSRRRMKKGRRPGVARPRRTTPPREAATTAPPGFPSTAVALLWAWLVALVAARALTASIPTMWGWSLNLHRFLDPCAAWGPWALAAIALIPALALRAAPALQSVGDWTARHPSLWLAVAGLAATGLVLLLPDRVGFVGDFLLREGTLRENVRAQA